MPRGELLVFIVGLIVVVVTVEILLCDVPWGKTQTSLSFGLDLSGSS